MQQKKERFTFNIFCVIMAVLTAIMVMVGGLTRLNDAGLSMVDWQPIRGVIPPMTLADWEVEFSAYQASPQYQLVMKGISIKTFKPLFLWEWGHRMLGRLLGLVALLGVLVFRSRQALIILGWIALQGLMGWIMVQSGLVDRPSVSHVRLAIHLWLAFGLFLYCVIHAKKPMIQLPKKVGLLLKILLGMMVLQITYGAFVAGLDAGIGYATFPKMGQEWIASSAWLMTPRWTNLISNPVMVQFIHRWLGIIIGLMALGLWGYQLTRKLEGPVRRYFHMIAMVTILQVILGICTLIDQVPIHLAVMHQLVGLGLFGMIGWGAGYRTPNSD